MRGVVAGDAPWIAAVTIIATAVFVGHAVPFLGFGDAGEFASAAEHFGVTHPPGHPLAVLVLRVVRTLFGSVSAAYSLNLLSASIGGVAAGVWCAVAHSVARYSLRTAALHRAVGIAGGLFVASATTLQSQAVAFERTFLAFTLILGIVVALVLQPPSNQLLRDQKRMALVVYLVALGCMVHPLSVLAAPFVLTALLLRSPRIATPRMIMRCSVLAALAGTVYATVPIRSSFRPWANWGAIAVCDDATDRVHCLLRAETARRAISHVRREYYAEAGSGRKASVGVQYGAWWRYLGNQWYPACFEMGTRQRAAAILVASLTLVGLMGLGRRAPPWVAVAMVVLGLTYTVGLVWQMNFRPMPSQVMLLRDFTATEGRERDYFFLPGFAFVGVFVALGLGRVAQVLCDVTSLPGRTRSVVAWENRWNDRVGWLPLAVGGVACLLAIASTVDERRSGIAESWGRDVLSSVDSNAVLVISRDDYHWPLAYLQSVKGIRRDVTVLNISEMVDPDTPLARVGRPDKLGPLATRSLSSAMESVSRWNRPLFTTLDSKHQAAIVLPRANVVTTGFAARVDVARSPMTVDTVTYPVLGVVDADLAARRWRESRGVQALARVSTWCDPGSRWIVAWYQALTAPALAWALRHGDDTMARDTQKFLTHLDKVLR